MRGFETLLAASVATAGITQIAVMVARAPHGDAVSVEPPVSACCQYRTWPVESSFWTFPFTSQFHATGRAPFEGTPGNGPFAVPATPGSDPPPDLLYSPTSRGSGPLAARDFPWVDVVAGADTPTSDAVSETPQNESTSIWIDEGSAASANAHPPAQTPHISLFLADPGPADDGGQTPTPSFFDISPSSPAAPDISLPMPQDLGDTPPTVGAGDPGGPDSGPPSGTPPANVPEPATLIVLLTSLLGLTALRRGPRA